MNDEAILVPVLVLMALTFLVWLYMYILRIHYIGRARIDVQSLTSSDIVARMVPEATNRPAANLKNLCELPTLFYALCLYLHVTNRVNQIDVALAWAFVFLRIVHSSIHCTYNRVIHRFIVYVLGALTLWAMLARTLVAAIF